MVLNLLRVEGINPEYMLEKSFYQFQNYAVIPELFDSEYQFMSDLIRSSFSATSINNWVQIFTGLLFYACWDTHQVRRPVLANYQKVSSAFKAAESAILFFSFES